MAASLDRLAELAAIEGFLRDRGATRCPAAIVTPTRGAVISPTDRGELARHFARREKRLAERWDFLQRRLSPLILLFGGSDAPADD